MKKNRRLLMLFTLFCLLGQSSAFGQIACHSNITGVLSTTANGSEWKVYAQSVVESTTATDVQISKDNVFFEDFLVYDCDDIGTQTIFARGTVDGVLTTCFSDLIVIDNTNPIPYATNNVIVSLNGANSVTVPASAVDAGSYDNCTVESITLEPNTFTANGVYTVTLTVTDQSGNSDFASSLITVVDGTPTCNESMYISLDPTGQALMQADIFVEGNADYDVVEVSLDDVNFGESVVFDCDDIGVVQTVYVHIENGGNEYSCTTEAMIEDKFAPVVIVQNYTINLASETDTYTLLVEDVDLNSFDNCTGLVLELSQTEFSSDDWGVNQVVVTGTDLGGQTASATSTVIVLIDGEAPPMQCVSLSTALTSPFGDLELYAADFVENSDDFAQIVASLDPAGPFTESFIADCGINGGDPYTVYVQASTGSVQYSCDVELTVVDVTPPVAIADPTVYLELENGSATLTPEEVDDGSYDHCTAVTLTLDQTIFTVADIGSNTVTMTVTDMNGLSNIVLSTVIVSGSGSGCSLEFVQFPDNIDIYDENGTVSNLTVDNLQAIYGYDYEDVHPYTFSECTAIFYAYTDQIFNISNGYKAIRTWTAIDWLTSEVTTNIQILKLYTSYSSVLACNGLESVTVQNGPVTLLPIDVLEGGPYDYDNMTLSIEDENGDVVVNNIITEDYIGQTLVYQVTDITSSVSCWGDITVENMVSGCALDDDDVSYPLATIQVPDSGLNPEILTPEYLMENYGYSESDVLITWLDDVCHIVGYTYEDEVFDYGDGSFKIIRFITVIDWISFDPGGNSSGIWTFTQIINVGVNPETLICDFLPRTAAVGDCESGHTLDDDVEWPADLEISDYRISPEELVEFSMVDVLDSKPSLYNNEEDYEMSKVDLLVDIDANTVVLGRVWTVTHVVYGFAWNYSQTITIDFSEFENLVTINTGTERAMAGVTINDSFSTNGQGDAYVEGEPISSITYEDEYLNGINILDLILIQRHILDLNTLPEYGLLAADINNDDEVNGQDVVELRKRISGDVATDKGEWSFYNKEVESTINVEPKGVFVGVKSGDVDDSALLIGEELEEPTSNFEVADLLLNQGESYSIPVFVSDELDAYGVQFTATIDSDIMEVVDITTEYTDDNFDFHITEEGVLTYVFHEAESSFIVGGDASEPIFTINIEAKQNSLLSLGLELNSHESFIVSSEFKLIILGGEIEGEIGTGTNSEELSRLSVYPNPTTEYLNIELKNVDVKGDLEVSIYELNGQKLFTRYNSPQIDVLDLKSGMYYYQIKIDTYTTTGKFMVVK